VLSQADRILCVTQGVQEDLLSRHPMCRDSRWHHLPNGFDAADFKGIKPAAAERRIVLTYTGSLYGHRNPSGLLRALEGMLRKNPRLSKQLMVRLVGRVGDAIWREVLASPAAGLFQRAPYVTHAESLGYLLASDAALLIIDDAPANRGIVTGKFFEYLGARLPIVALAPEGEAADLIRRYKLGWVARPDDIPAITAIMERLIERGKKKKIRTAEKHLLKFERREQTRSLAALLNELTGETKKEL
jgi:glycosyltransferase involved in cell wall biosynthesis